MIMATPPRAITDALQGEQRACDRSEQWSRPSRAGPHRAWYSAGCCGGLAPHFWVNVPIGLVGTVWALPLEHETGVRTAGTIGMVGQRDLRHRDRPRCCRKPTASSPTAATPMGGPPAGGSQVAGGVVLLAVSASSRQGSPSRCSSGGCSATGLHPARGNGPRDRLDRRGRHAVDDDHMAAGHMVR